MKRKILICGSTGFIGRNIAETIVENDHFNDKFDVHGTYLDSEPLENNKIKMVRSDLTNKNDVENVIKGMDVIIQAAATTSGVHDIFTKPYYHVTDNALMNAHIFRSAYDHGISHVIFLSCTTMYQPSNIPIKETDFDANEEIHPSYFGGAWTKVYNEKMCEFYSRIGKTKYTVIRHSNIYGPYDKFDLERSHVFGATMTKTMMVKDGGKIIVWGQGYEERDLLYISDLVDFITLAINKQDTKFEIFNVGYGSSISINDLVEKIIYHSGKNIGIGHDLTKPSINTKLCLDITKSKNLLGWSPKTSLDNGIQKTIEWYRKYYNITEKKN